MNPSDPKTETEIVTVKCSHCKADNRFFKHDFWGKIFRCRHCAKVLTDLRHTPEPKS